MAHAQESDTKSKAGVSRGFREWAQFIMLLFATGWGVYTFVYKETILPSRRPATLTVTATLEELGRNAENVLIRLRVHAVNRTDRKVYVPALWYTVRGLKMGKLSASPEEYRSYVESTPQAEVHARYSAVYAAESVAVGTILRQITDYYEPTDETTNEILFEVPLANYDALEAKAQFFVTRQIDGLSNYQWSVATNGELDPQLTLLGRPYDPEYNPQHHAWALSSGAGFNWSSSTLSLWAKPQSEEGSYRTAAQ